MKTNVTISTILIAMAAALSTEPANGQSVVVGGSSSDASFYSGSRPYLHYASGRYWTAFRNDSTASGRVRLYTSADGTTWSAAGGTADLFDFLPPIVGWAVRFQGNVIVGFAYNPGDTRRYYTKGTLASDGTVTWQQRAAYSAVLPAGSTDQALSAAIVNAKPVLYAADQGNPGWVSIGSSLDSPTWAGPYAPPALNTNLGAQYGTAGTVFSAGAVFPLYDKDPNDFIIVRASGAAVATPQAHRVVSIKFDASAGAFAGNMRRNGSVDTAPCWFNVSTAGNGVTLTEDATTGTWLTANDTGLHSRFAATQQPDGLIHVAYINQNGDVVYYRRGPGQMEHEVADLGNDFVGWNQVQADADGQASAVGKVGLTVIDANNVFLFYALNAEPEAAIYVRRYEGKKVWTSTGTITLSGAGDINYALGTMETATGCNAGVAWNQNSSPGPYDVYFRKVNPSCTAPAAYLRSIGTRADYGTNMTEGAGTTVTVTSGSKTVDGTGTAWLAANRGMGDVIVIPCPNPPTCTGGTPYMIASIQSETRVTLTAPFAGTTASGLTYVIRRQLTGGGNAAAALVAWENCIDGGPCPYFTPASASLVADNRVEIGVTYKDSIFQPPAAAGGGLRIRDSRTSGTHRIVLTAAPGNRHNGTPAAAGCTTNCASVVYEGPATAPTTDVHAGIEIFDANVTLEWLELRRFSGGLPGTTSANAYGAISVLGRGPLEESQNTVLDHLLVHDFPDTDAMLAWEAIRGHDYCCKSFSVTNTMVWDGDYRGIAGDEPGDVLRVDNCTVDYIHGLNHADHYGVYTESSIVTVRNTIATNTPASRDFHYDATSPGGFVTDGTTRYSSNNVSSATATYTGPGPNAQTGVAAASLYVVPGSNLHLIAGATAAIDTGLNLASSTSAIDIDGQVRPSGGSWDRGADEFGGTTAVRLMSFEAAAAEGAVELWWQTGSELENLGFHLYRSLSGSGPWTRLTSTLVPGQGSSAVEASYSWRDSGLVNGTRYYYRLEDVDTSSVSTFHGPVSTVPSAPGGDGGDDGGADGTERGDSEPSLSSCPRWVLAAAPDALSPTCTRYGEPESVSLAVLARTSSSATVELRTGGFYALREPSGLVRAFVPGFELPSDPQASALPLRRAVVDAVVGRGVVLAAVRATDEVALAGLIPASVGEPEMRVQWDGTVRAGRRERGGPLPRHVAPLARLLPSVFQGERKSAVVEISPLRVDARSGELRLARSVVVRLAFTGREAGESGAGSVGRARLVRRAVSGEVLARLYTAGQGLHAVSFEALFPGRARAMAASTLRLEQQGVARALHLEPAGESFGPGSRLLFYADTAARSTDFSSETAWELVRSRRGAVAMPLLPASPGADEVLSPSTARASFETNRVYLPGLLEAEDPWLWEALPDRATKTVSFALTGVDTTATLDAQLELFLQGGSESGSETDHHLAVLVNEVPAGEAEFAGKRPYRMTVSVPASLLREGENELALTNVGDTGVLSYVYLDRLAASYPRRPSLVGGVFEGTWDEGGTATLAGLAGPAMLLDVTASPASWLSGQETTEGLVRFRAEAGHRYLAVCAAGLLSPRVAPVQSPPPALRSTANQADYLVIGPRAFLGTAEPLVERRREQGLRSRAVALEAITEEFGHGQPSAEAIREFLSYAFHSWARPSPRYVLLLGDSSYDPRNFGGSSPAPPLPALWMKTSYLWTVSDPSLAAVNGEDPLPDLAIGRLPARTVQEAEALVAKVLAWEDSGGGLGGGVALVADNPDLAGDFEASVDDVARSFLAGREVTTLRVRELGSGTRPAIRGALDSGLGLVSYVGHGGAAAWASENVWNTWDAPSLAAQPEQPVLLTLNCLNGYFVAPVVDSLAESLLRVEGRGVVAAISPSGLSLDGPAHQLHRAVMSELTGGGHERLGDALLAAQAAYARTGLMPELLSVYHLLGDPALKIR